MLHISKVITLLFLSITIPFYLVQGQESDNFNTMEKGSKALQFQVSGNFTLNSFAGSAISYKYQVSQNQARRIGISLENSFSQRDYPESETELSNNQLDLSFGVEYTWMNYTNPDSDMKFYYGYGPRLNGRYDKLNQVTGDQSIDRKRSTIGLAGLGYAGIEWFFKPSMSLHAEYRVSAQVDYFHDKEVREIENVGTTSNEYTIKTFTVNGDGVRFGLSVYF